MCIRQYQSQELTINRHDLGLLVLAGLGFISAKKWNSSELSPKLIFCCVFVVCIGQAQEADATSLYLEVRKLPNVHAFFGQFNKEQAFGSRKIYINGLSWTLFILYLPFIFRSRSSFLHLTDPVPIFVLQVGSPGKPSSQSLVWWSNPRA